MTPPSDTYHILMCRREVLREPFWFLKKTFSSRVSAEKQYDRYFKQGVKPKNMRIVKEI